MPAKVSRRNLFAGAMVAAVAGPASKSAAAITAVDPAILAVIEELETVAGWEPFNSAVAKCYAAYRMRVVLGLDVPDPKLARDYVVMQHEDFERYKRTIWYERALAEGRAIVPPPSLSILGA